MERLGIEFLSVFGCEVESPSTPPATLGSAWDAPGGIACAGGDVSLVRADALPEEVQS